jgi:hypothetical protein
MESSPLLRAQERCGVCKAFRVCFSCLLPLQMGNF